MAEYIEREALIAAYDATHKGAAGGARKLMVDAPAADVEPVRHGRWTISEKHVFSEECSVCKGAVEWKFPYGEMHRYSYCPNCGATMDLEVSE